MYDLLYDQKIFERKIKNFSRKNYFTEKNSGDVWINPLLPPYGYSLALIAWQSRKERNIMQL